MSEPQTVDLKGESVEHLHLLTSNEAGWNGLNLVYEREPAGEAPETWLGQHLLVICLGNFRANYQLKGLWQPQDYTGGDIVIFPAHEPFPRVQVDREVELIELFLEPETLARATDGEAVELIPQWRLRDPLIEQMGLALKSELESAGADSKFYAESMTTALAAHLRQRYSSHPLQPYSGGLSQSQLKAAIAYIHAHLEQHITLAELASVVFLSSHYFAHLFKQSTGRSPHQYVTQCRIAKAKRLLRQSYIPISDICQQVGFQNQSHFTRVFRRYTHTTPKAYRNSL